MKQSWRRLSRLLLLLMLLPLQNIYADMGGRVTLSMRDAELGDVMQMLSRQNRVNILLSDGVEGEVSFNLYNVKLDEAIESIANAAGFFVEKRRGTFFILPEDRAGKTPASGFTIVKTFPVRYADPTDLETKLNEYVSDFGKITALPQRKLLMIEDRPSYVYRITNMLKALDGRPRQVLIEAKVLEISLNDEESYGIDWADFFTSGVSEGTFGTQGLDSPGNSGNAGFFFDYLDPSFEVAIRALETDGRIRNLASPKLVTVENEEAEVIIGDRRGYRVTTTINQVTTESIEFLESGVILRVTPTIDDDGKILLDIHPEVSTGTVDENGVPSQTTTEVTTQLVVPSGQAIFIGGLMRTTSTEARSGIPVLGRLPGVRWLFGNQSRTVSNTETVVVITPRLLDDDFNEFSDAADRAVDSVMDEMIEQSDVVEEHIEDVFGESATLDMPVTKETPAPDESTRPTRAEREPLPEIKSSAVERPVEFPELTSNAARRPVVFAPLESSAERRRVAMAPLESSAVRRPTALTDGLYVVNLHSDTASISDDEASALRDLTGRPVYVTEKEFDGATWHRLRIGFFATEDEAAAAVADWKAEYPRAWAVKISQRERASAMKGLPAELASR